MSGDEAANTPNEDKPDAGDPTDPSAGGVRTMRGGNGHEQNNGRIFLIDHRFTLQVYEKLLRRGFPSRPMYHRHDREGIRRRIPSRHLNRETTVRPIVTINPTRMIVI